MKPINILPPQIFNLLSAGEVVENPASVVKESIENSLDAGATIIEVAIIRGGIDEIKIEDNGHGVPEGEVEKIFLPHATSKIEVETDLDAIKTLGFRGEAMSSIARVSKVVLTTKTEQESIATRIALDGGNIVKCDKVAANKGTTLVVRNLFFNTPARKKFLGTEGVERNNVTNIIQKFILANPTVSFRYLVDGFVYYEYHGRSLLDAIELVYGAETAKSLVRVSATSLNFKVEGYISKPEFTKRNKTYQTIMVNSRVVQGGIVAEATAEAMSQYLMIGLHPFFVLDLAVDAESVDVNIHPRKLQVKFDDEDSVREFIRRAVISTMDDFVYLQTVPLTEAIKKKVEPSLDILKFTEGVNNEVIAPAPHSIKKFSGKFFEDEPILPTQAVFAEPPRYKALGTIFGCFILVTLEDSLYIIDQHAGAERTLYDRLKQQIDLGGVVTQQLVSPIMLHLNPAEMNSVVPLLSPLSRIGIEAEEFGNNTLCIRAVPSLIAANDALDDVLQGILGEVKKYKLSQMLESKLLQIACKNSLKGGRTLSPDQIQYFLDSFKSSKIPPLCPHGRPVLVSLTKKDIEKMFGRK
ncbi:MAG: DNA mismatch repair endonuclease MutL [Firmicutes bacterium]|nr:DNA mismatch repair endonuclease MutL [Bacillota bacterium]